MNSNWAKFCQKRNPPVKKSKSLQSTKVSQVSQVSQLSHSVSSVDNSKNWWEDDSDSEQQQQHAQSTSIPTQPTVLSKSDIMKIGKYVAMDCEMVGVGPEGRQSALARVSIVNFNGHVIIDKYVKTVERVTDYRTRVSGITPRHLVNAHQFTSVQSEVAEILKDKIVVGHAIHNDFEALLLQHPKRLIRDTSRYGPFRKMNNGSTPSLKMLASTFLKQEIQTGQHCSVEDARIVMELYKMHKHEWEAFISKKESIKRKKTTKKIKTNK